MGNDGHAPSLPILCGFASVSHTVACARTNKSECLSKNEVFRQSEAENPNATINMEGNTTLKVGRNVINIIVTSEDTENKDTYVLSVTREKEEQKVVQTCPDETSTREWIMFTVSMLLTFTLGIVLGYFLCKC